MAVGYDHIRTDWRVNAGRGGNARCRGSTHGHGNAGSNTDDGQYGGNAATVDSASGSCIDAAEAAAYTYADRCWASRERRGTAANAIAWCFESFPVIWNLEKLVIKY